MNLLQLQNTTHINLKLIDLPALFWNENTDLVWVCFFKLTLSL